MNIFRKIVFWSIIFASLVISSCSTVKQNGYYQTKNYRNGYVKNILGVTKSTPKSIGYLSEISALVNGTGDQDNSSPNKSLNKTTHAGLGFSSSELGFSSLDKDCPFSPDQEIKLGLPTMSLGYVSKVSDEGLSREGVISERNYPDPVQRNLAIPQDDGKTVHWAAIVGLSAGVLAWVVAGLFFGACAVVFSAIALAKISKNPELYKGKGMAIAGLVLGILAILIMAIWIGMVLGSV